MPRGSKKGERRGGRTKGTKNKATLEIKQILAKNVNFNVVVKKLMELVNGVTVVDHQKRKHKDDDNDNPPVYDKPPDSFAAKILLEYGFGKPNQATEVTFPEGIKIIRDNR